MELVGQVRRALSGKANANSHVKPPVIKHDELGNQSTRWAAIQGKYERKCGVSQQTKFDWKWLMIELLYLSSYILNFYCFLICLQKTSKKHSLSSDIFESQSPGMCPAVQTLMAVLASVVKQRLWTPWTPLDTINNVDTKREREKSKEKEHIIYIYTCIYVVMSYVFCLCWFMRYTINGYSFKNAVQGTNQSLNPSQRFTYFRGSAVIMLVLGI